jgi:hypothetical protein
MRDTTSACTSGKLVELYARLMEYSCVVHNPEDLGLIASWKMPVERSVHQAAAIAAFQTEEETTTSGKTFLGG